MRPFSPIVLLALAACGAAPNVGGEDPWQVDPPALAGEVGSGDGDAAADALPADPAALHTAEAGVRAPSADAPTGPAAIVPGIYVAEVLDASGTPCEAAVASGVFEVLVTLEGPERVVDGFALLRRHSTDGLRIDGGRTLPGGDLACAEHETLHGSGHFIDPMAFELELTHRVAAEGPRCATAPACEGTVRARFTWDRAPASP